MHSERIKVGENDDRVSLPVIFLALWIVATAVFGPPFYVIPFAGLVDITIERILLLIIVVWMIVGFFQRKAGVQKNFTIEFIMGLFVLLCLVSMTKTGFLPVNSEFISPWYVFISGYFFPFVIFIFAKKYIVNEKDMFVVLHALFYFAIYLCIISFLEFTNLKQFVFPRYIADPEMGIHFDRARGPFLNATYNGEAILIGFVCGIHLLQKKTSISRFFYQLALLMCFPAVLFTLTRSVYLAMLIVLIVLLGSYKTSFPKWKWLPLPLIIVLIAGIAYSHRVLSMERRAGGGFQVEEANVRSALLERSAYLLLQNPFMGIGLAQFQPSTQGSYKGRTPYDAQEATALQHNHLLGIATELGIPGILLYLSLIILVLRRMKQLAGRLEGTGIMGRNLSVVIFSIWCVYLTNNLFLEPSNNLFINVIPFLFAGLTDGMYTRSLQSGLASSPSYISRSPMRIIRSHV
jgi:O-antigen ligase